MTCHYNLHFQCFREDSETSNVRFIFVFTKSSNRKTEVKTDSGCNSNDEMTLYLRSRPHEVVVFPLYIVIALNITNYEVELIKFILKPVT